MVRHIEVAFSVDGQSAGETDDVKIFDRGLGCWEQAAIALVAGHILLSQDHIDDWVDQRIANAQDPMVVRIAQP